MSGQVHLQGCDLYDTGYRCTCDRVRAHNGQTIFDEAKLRQMADELSQLVGCGSPSDMQTLAMLLNLKTQGTPPGAHHPPLNQIASSLYVHARYRRAVERR